MTVSNTTNGRPQRKQLADQLDRFDALLDGLSEGLMGAITDAVRDGTRLAMKDAVIEILTDPTLHAKLHQAAAPEKVAQTAQPETRPSFWSRIKGAATKTLTAIGQTLTGAARHTGQAAVAVVAAARNPLQLARLIGSLKHLLMVGAGAGLAVAIVSFFAPHVVSATLSGVTGGIAAMAVRASLWTRRTINVLSLA